MNKRCQRCNGPYYQHDDANKSGGMGRLIDWQDGYCGVCLDKIQDYEQRASWFLLERKLASGTDETQASLSSF